MLVVPFGGLGKGFGTFFGCSEGLQWYILGYSVGKI